MKPSFFHRLVALTLIPALVATSVSSSEFLVPSSNARPLTPTSRLETRNVRFASQSLVPRLWNFWSRSNPEASRETQLLRELEALPIPETDPTQQWREDVQKAIARGKLRPYVGLTVDAVQSRAEGPRREPRQPGSLRLSASDLLRILPPFPAPANVEIKANTDRHVELTVIWNPEGRMDEWTTHLNLEMSLVGSGTADHPYEVLTTGHISGKEIRNYLINAGAPTSEKDETPSFKFFTRLTEWLQELPWEGEAWITGNQIPDDPKDPARKLYERLGWEDHPLKPGAMRKQLARIAPSAIPPVPHTESRRLTLLEKLEIGWVVFDEFLGQRQFQRRQKTFDDAAAALDHALHQTHTVPDTVEAITTLAPHLNALRARLTETGYREFKLPYELLTNTLQDSWGDMTPEEQRGADILLYQSFVVDYLALVAARAGDGGRGMESANEVTVRRLLDRLQSPETAFHVRIVSDVSQLLNVPTSALSPNEGALVEDQKTYRRIFRGHGGPPAYSRRFVQEQGRHLRGLIMEQRRRKNAEQDARRAIERTRAANSVDYATMILNLIPLLEYYDRFGNEDGLAIDIAAGLSGDPDLLLNPALLATLNPASAKILFQDDTAEQLNVFRPGIFYPTDLEAPVLRRYFNLLGRVRARLLSDLRAFENEGPDTVASVFGNTDLYPAITLTQLWMARLEHPQAAGSFVYDDLARPDASAARMEWRRALDQMGCDLKYSEPDESEIQIYVQPFDRATGLYAFSETLKGLEEFTGDGADPLVTRPDIVSGFLMIVSAAAATLLGAGGHGAAVSTMSIAGSGWGSLLWLAGGIAAAAAFGVFPSQIIATKIEGKFAGYLDTGNPSSLTRADEYPAADWPLIRTRAYALSVIQASATDAAHRAERELQFPPGTLEHCGQLLLDHQMAEFLANPANSLGAKQAAVLRILCLLKPGTFRDKDIVDEILQRYVPGLQEDRYRILGTIGTEQEVKKQFVTMWNAFAVPEVYEHVLQMWKGDDDRYEFKIYPSYSWKTQAAIIQSLLDLNFLPTHDDSGPIWNSLHTNVVISRRDDEAVKYLAPVIELINVLLYTSLDRTRYFFGSLLEPLRIQGGLHDVMGTYDDPDRFLEREKEAKGLLRVEYRTGEVGTDSAGSDFAGRLYATQVLHGLMNFYAMRGRPGGSPDARPETWAPLFEEFLEGLQELRSHYPTFEQALHINWYSHALGKHRESIFSVKPDRDLRAQVRALVNKTLAQAEALLDIATSPSRSDKLLGLGVLAAAAVATLLDYLWGGPAVGTAGVTGGWATLWTLSGLATAFVAITVRHSFYFFEPLHVAWVVFDEMTFRPFLRRLSPERFFPGKEQSVAAAKRMIRTWIREDERAGQTTPMLRLLRKNLRTENPEIVDLLLLFNRHLLAEIPLTILAGLLAGAWFYLGLPHKLFLLVVVLLRPLVTLWQTHSSSVRLRWLIIPLSGLPFFVGLLVAPVWLVWEDRALGGYALFAYLRYEWSYKPLKRFALVMGAVVLALLFWPQAAGTVVDAVTRFFQGLFGFAAPGLVYSAAGIGGGRSWLLWLSGGLLAGVFREGGEGAAPVKLHTDIKVARKGLQAFQQLMESLPPDLAAKLQSNYEWLNRFLRVYTGITPETALFKSFIPSVTHASDWEAFADAVKAQTGFAIVVRSPKAYSILNLEAASRVIQNNADLFLPATPDNPQWLAEHPEAWVPGDDNSELAEKRWGLLSGFPRNAVDHYQIYRTAMEKLDRLLKRGHISFSASDWDSMEYILGDRQFLSRSIEIQNSIRETLSKVQSLNSEEIELLTQGQSARGAMGGYAGFNDSDRAWSRALTDIFTAAVNEAGLGPVQDGHVIPHSLLGMGSGGRAMRLFEETVLARERNFAAYSLAPRDEAEDWDPVVGSLSAINWLIRQGFIGLAAWYLILVMEVSWQRVYRRHARPDKNGKTRGQVYFDGQKIPWEPRLEPYLRQFHSFVTRPILRAYFYVASIGDAEAEELSRQAGVQAHQQWNMGHDRRGLMGWAAGTAMDAVTGFLQGLSGFSAQGLAYSAAGILGNRPTLYSLMGWAVAALSAAMAANFSFSDDGNRPFWDSIKQLSTELWKIQIGEFITTAQTGWAKTVYLEVSRDVSEVELITTTTARANIKLKIKWERKLGKVEISWPPFGTFDLWSFFADPLSEVKNDGTHITILVDAAFYRRLVHFHENPDIGIPLSGNYRGYSWSIEPGLARPVNSQPPEESRGKDRRVIAFPSRPLSTSA